MVPIKYPLTIGAFKSNTYIDDLLVLPNTDIVILGSSSDTSLVTLSIAYTSRRFLTYFDNAASVMNYKWAIQLPEGLDSYTYRSLDFKEDLTQVAVMLTKSSGLDNIYSVMLVNMADGIIARHHQFKGRDFDERMKSFCIFFN